MKASTKTFALAKASRLLRAMALTCSIGAAALGTSQVNVLTYHNDIARTGQNNSETTLNPSNVNSNTFGLLFTLPVDGYVFAQPLYLSKLAIPNKGTHNVVLVCTEHDSVYAFDADSNTGANAQPLWHVNFGQSLSSGDVGTDDIYPEIGITGTPVIVMPTLAQTGTPTMYVVSKTKTYVNGNPVFTQQLHALDCTTGAEKYGGPVTIQGTVAGVGDGTDGSGHVPFNTLIQNQRPALLALSAGLTVGGTGSTGSNIAKGPAGPPAATIYVGYASHGDNGPYHGWLFAYNANTLQQTGIFNTGPNAKTDPSGYPLAAGGIWMGGGGLASDGFSLYYSTGNGSFNPSQGSYGDSIVRMTLPGLTLGDYFTPNNQQSMDDYDSDLGSGGIMLLPNSVGSTKNPALAVQTGKTGTIYLMNRANLGKYNATDNVVGELNGISNGTWGAPAYFNGNIYIGQIYGSMLALPIANATFTAGGANAWTPTYYQYPGPTPSISSNGNANGIVWALQDDGSGPNGTAILHAYLASNIGNELYNSANTNGRDTLGGAVKFTTPTIANGKVFCGNQYEVSVFGLGQWAAAPTVTPASGNYQNQVQVTCSDTTPNAQIYYTTDGSTPTQSSNLYQGAVTLTTSATFTARAFASGYGPSPAVQNNYQINAVIGNGTGLFGNYYNNYSPASGNNPFAGLTPTASELDPTINFNWGGNSPINGVAGSNWGAQWTGHIQAETTSTYTFYTYSDDGVQVWINGTPVINDWTYHASTLDTGTITLQAGQKYTIVVDFFQGGGASLVSLGWSAPGLPYQIVPTSQLYPN